MMGPVVFTGKERDAETGLDYFGARYMSSAQGRFTSPDPFLGSGRPEDPQSWNRYAYARNNPLVYIDPTGMDYEHLEGRQKKLVDEWAAAQNKANKTNINAEKMYNGLAESQRSTYEGVTHAMMNTAITDANGKSVGNALDLVGSLTTIAGGVEDGGAAGGAKSDQQFRVYFDSNITSADGKPLAGSAGFAASQNGFGLHEGYPNSFRSNGGKVPSLQLSMSGDFRRGDGDVDYRQSGLIGVFNGHLTSANSDVRVGNNYQNHIKRFGPGLVDWWNKKK
jgi:RHS repeat-associated protein